MLETTAARDASDEQLLTDAARGDLKAFETLLRRHERPLVNYVIRLGGSAEAGEEIFLETSRRLFDHLDDLPLSDRVDIWLIRMARKILTGHASWKDEGQATPVAPPPEVGAAVSDDPSRRTETSVRRRLEPWIRSALATIPRQRREALVLRVYHNLTYREISRVTGAPAQTVYYWIHISLAEFAKQVDG